MEQIALNRYDQTWKRFIKELNNNPTITLRTVCKTMHTDYRPMKKWLSRVGYSVLVEKAAHRSMKIDDTSLSAFAVLVPNDNPPIAHNKSSLTGISITFNSGTTINIKQADADSIIRLISMYERKDGEICTL